MKAYIRIIIIITIVFISIIVSGIYSYKYLDTSAQNMSSKVELLENLISNNDFEGAKSTIKELDNVWEKNKSKWVYLLDHFEIDNISASLAKLDKFIDTKNITMALSESSELNGLFKHIPQKEALTLQNIF